MTRWYFPATRAHHALCMMRDHGMQFVMKGQRWTDEGLANLDRASDYRIYVAPESEHLLGLMPETLMRNGPMVIGEHTAIAIIPFPRFKALHWPETEP